MERGGRGKARGRGEGRGGGTGTGRGQVWGGGRGEGRGDGGGGGTGVGRGQIWGGVKGTAPEAHTGLASGGGRGEGRGEGGGTAWGGRGEGRGEGGGTAWGGRGEGRGAASGGGRGEGRGGGTGVGKGQVWGGVKGTAPEGDTGPATGGGRGQVWGGVKGTAPEGDTGPATGGGKGQVWGGVKGTAPEGDTGPATGGGKGQVWGGVKGTAPEGGKGEGSGGGGGGGGKRGKKQQMQEKKPPQSVESTMSTLSVRQASPSDSNILQLVPARKNKQGSGRKSGSGMMVEANHFEILMKKRNVIAYQYDVVIEPNVPKYMIRLAWNEFVKRNFPGKYPSFDGNKIAVNAGPLMDSNSVSDSFEVYNPESNKTKEYKVEIKYASQLNLENVRQFMESRNLQLSLPMAELAAIDIVLRNNSANKLVRAGRSFFPKPQGNILSLGDGMEVWYGYYQSAVLGWKMFLNFDVSHKGFPTCDILKTVQEICLTDFRGNAGPVTPQTTLPGMAIKKLEKHLKSLKVEYSVPGCQGSKRVYKVNGVRNEPARNERFKLDNNTVTNVVNYYRDVKNYQIKYPNLPCLWVGSAKNTIYVPMELCTIVPGQVRNGKLNETQTSNMIRYAADPPPGRKMKILDQFRHAEFENEYTNEFGISVAGKMEKIEARVLDPPKLEAQRQIRVQRGRWDLDTFLEAKPLKNWCVLILDDRAFKFEQIFIKEIMEQARMKGMEAERPISHGITGCDPFARPQSVSNAFTTLKTMGVKLAFVIIPDRGDIYSKVKRICEIEVGLLTQCIRSSTINKTFSRGTNRSTLSNILLKVNAKLNGVNHGLHQNSRPRCLQKVTMIVGADVTHPSPDAISSPSIAAVAASHDTKATQYNTIRRIQPSKTEVILDFKEIIREQLLYFYKKNRLKPQQIIVFRDGVSEGQVAQVLKEELRAIQQACISLQSGDNKMDYQPLITFLIVQKRHHTRFFPMAGSEFCNERSPNVPAGTCVDTVIVHPRDLDFYLVSHMSRLGTARPTKYKLIYDDSDMTEDELENLSYYLCHLVARCTMSISYPAPTYYAHLAAFRARAHISGINVDTTSRENKMEGQKKINVKDYFIEEAPMFFV